MAAAVLTAPYPSGSSSRMDKRPHSASAFTLIEMSIVLVIIGLIVGGVLVGQSLINSAKVRAQVTQIEQYNTAANAFREKYGYLPGDIPNPSAGQFGFQTRGQYTGEGDGNGVIEGITTNGANSNCGACALTGESAMFWVDLSAAHFVGGFNTATPTTMSNPSLPLSDYLPEAKLGSGNFIYLFSGACSGCSVYPPSFFKGAGNYFGIVGNMSLLSDGYHFTGTPNLTVQQAYSIDKKVDDGLPQSGQVLALYVTTYGSLFNLFWAGTLSQSSPSTQATAGSASTCFDNGNVSGNPQQYSVEQNSGSDVTCTLAFKMQAGDQ
jgi:prepilin-type N-terminal cleavage/methylation domain-containing protein